MARPLRIDDPDGWHHVMNRGLDHQPIFFHDRDRVTCESLLEQLTTEHGIEVHAYCLMGNHYHWLLHCPTGGLSAGMQQFSSSYTRIVNERLDRDGPIFRGRFHSVPVQSETQIARTAAYIHRNPIDLVPQAALETYRWSSYGPYLGRRETPPWLSRSMVDELLTPALHRELVSLPLESPGQSSVTKEIIDRIVGARIDLSCTDGKRLRLLLGFDVAELTAQEVAEWIGLTSAGAARTALSRARAARLDAVAFDALVAQLEAQVRAAT
jgi:REP element-mobilizing transposase RayT